jgi:nucleoside-diphosphate-sugar epimerase
MRDLACRRIPFRLCEDSVLSVVHVRDVAEAIVQALERPETVGGRYVIVGHQVSIGALNRMVSEIARVSLPERSLPDALLLPLAALLTGIARVTGRPPRWGLSLDQARVMRRGCQLDGARAARELGFEYSGVREAVAEVVGGRCSEAPKGLPSVAARRLTAGRP